MGRGWWWYISPIIIHIPKGKKIKNLYHTRLDRTGEENTGEQIYIFNVSVLCPPPPPILTHTPSPKWSLTHPYPSSPYPAL